MRLLAISFVIFGMAYLVGARVLGLTGEDRWRQDAQHVRKGMSAEEIADRLGEGERGGGHFPSQKDDEAVEYYLSWRKSGYELQVGIAKGRVETVRQWFKGL